MEKTHAYPSYSDRSWDYHRGRRIGLPCPIPHPGGAYQADRPIPVDR
jgi:hypothetical protein